MKKHCNCPIKIANWIVDTSVVMWLWASLSMRVIIITPWNFGKHGNHYIWSVGRLHRCYICTRQRAFVCSSSTIFAAKQCDFWQISWAFEKRLSNKIMYSLYPTTYAWMVGIFVPDNGRLYGVPYLPQNSSMSFANQLEFREKIEWKNDVYSVSHQVRIKGIRQLRTVYWTVVPLLYMHQTKGVCMHYHICRKAVRLFTNQL